MRSLRRLPPSFLPAIRTFSLVGIMLALCLAAAVLLIAWIRTPEALYATTDGTVTRIVRGGEPFSAVAGWLARELQPACWLLLAGLAGVRATAASPGPSEAV